MATREETFSPSLIENTTMTKLYRDDTFIAYKTTPIDGYVLHDNGFDIYTDFDMDGNPIGEPILGYGRGTVSCPANYDFTANPREFYAVPEDSVPADQIFGGGDNNHEVM